MAYPSTAEQKLQWKQQLKDSCISILQRRIEAAEDAMKQAQDAANSEGKSSAGDKYETSRSMGQLDRDMNAKQLEEAKRDLAFINSLDVSDLHGKAGIGTTVICKDYVFFIALGLGTTVIDDNNTILLSSQAPVANLLNGKKAGEQFIFNGRNIEVIDVF